MDEAIKDEEAGEAATSLLKHDGHDSCGPHILGRPEHQRDAVAGCLDTTSSKALASADHLSDGRQLPLCLWAVEVNLKHPVTRENLHLEIPLPMSLIDIMDSRISLSEI